MSLGLQIIGLQYDKYETTLKDVVKQLRDSDKRGRIIRRMVEGLQQLHNLGYSHGYLRFNHVVVNQNGTDVRLVGFGQARPINAPMKISQDHEDIYTPKYWRLRQGDPFLDIYAASVMIFLSYCWDRYYFKVFDIDQLIRLAKDKIKN